MKLFASIISVFALALLAPVAIHAQATATTATSSTATVAQDNHEYAPLEEKTVNYKNWTYKKLSDGAPVNLREFARGKKLLLVVYFAPWCPNWRNELPVASKLYEKYKSHGLEVVGVSEYGSRADAVACFGTQGPPYTVVSESESRDERDRTTHYGYRQSSGDKRRWGSPWNIFLEPARLNASGDVLTEKAWIVNGELIEADVEKFVRARLGLAPLNINAAVTTPCQQ